MPNQCDAPPDLEGRIPPGLKKSLTALIAQEATILRQLNSDPKLAQTFITNPSQALTQMGVHLDPSLLAALGAARQSNPFVSKTYSLPDGSKITPAIKFSFTPHKGKKV